jgi:hypothetical protein
MDKEDEEAMMMCVFIIIIIVYWAFMNGLLNGFPGGPDSSTITPVQRRNTAIFILVVTCVLNIFTIGFAFNEITYYYKQSYLALCFNTGGYFIYYGNEVINEMIFLHVINVAHIIIIIIGSSIVAKKERKTRAHKKNEMEKVKNHRMMLEQEEKARKKLFEKKTRNDMEQKKRDKQRAPELVNLRNRQLEKQASEQRRKENEEQKKRALQLDYDKMVQEKRKSRELMEKKRKENEDHRRKLDLIAQYKKYFKDIQNWLPQETQISNFQKIISDIRQIEGNCRVKNISEVNEEMTNSIAICKSNIRNLEKWQSMKSNFNLNQTSSSYAQIKEFTQFIENNLNYNIVTTAVAQLIDREFAIIDNGYNSVQSQFNKDMNELERQFKDLISTGDFQGIINTLNSLQTIAKKHEFHDKINKIETLIREVKIIDILFEFKEISNRVSINDVCERVNIARKDLIDSILKINKYIKNFRIDGEYIEIASDIGMQNYLDFIDNEFQTWNTFEKEKLGKKQ